ncbi:MAG: hypothetical protein ACTSVU_02800 [Promethearchaeota archaeon]
MDPKRRLSIAEFVLYSSPRYYRLIFPELKPKTKNGDLVSALSELKRWRFITPSSIWDQIILTSKGETYHTLIQELMDIGALHVPQSNGLFDYRSEVGRKVILELIRFLSAKLDFNQYFNYMHLPIFESENNPEWMKLFSKQGLPSGEEEKEIESEETQNENGEKSGVSNDKIVDRENGKLWLDYESPEGREQLMSYLTSQNRPHRNKVQAIHESLQSQDTPISLNLTLIKKFLKEYGLKRPEPLFNHLNNAEPHLFEIKNRIFHVILSELNNMQTIFEKYLKNMATDENKWLTDYFKLLTLSTGKTGLFGFMAGDNMQFTTKADAFLNLAIEGPRIFAGQFSSIKDLGELREIMFPINPNESLVIMCADLDMLYYFTIESIKCKFSSTINMLSLSNFPEKYITSRKLFGKLISRSRTLDEALTIQEIYQTDNPIKKKHLTENLRDLKENLQDKMDHLSYMSASLISICQMITQKYNQGFGLTKCLCFYENGYINFVDVGGMDQILTSITLSKIDFGQELKKNMGKIEKSIKDIVKMN